MRKIMLAMFLIIIICEITLGSPRVQAMESKERWIVLSSSVAGDSVAVTDLDLGDYQSEMTVGSKQLLMVTVLPVDATDQTVTYKSSNVSVATINAMGRIEASKAGTTTIFVKSGTAEKSFTLTVKEASQSSIVATDIDIGEYKAEFAVGENQLMLPTILPQNATNQTITFQSNNPSVATVNSLGRITAVSVGTTVISIKADSIVKTITLTVKAATDTNVAVSDIDLGDYQKEMALDTTTLIAATVLPQNATNQKMTYQSSDTKIATVNELGRITALKLGTTTITVKAENKVEKKFVLTVKKSIDKAIAATDIEISDFEDELAIEKDETITVKVFPSDATEQTVEYKSSHTKVATINSSGKISALKKGKTTITVKVGGVTKKLKLTVKVPAANIEMNEPYLVLNMGDEFQLEANVVPSEAKQTVTYSTTNSDILSVSESGFVKGLSTGNAAVIVTNGDMQEAVTVIIQDNKLTNISNQEVQSENMNENIDSPIDELANRIATSKEDTIILDEQEVKVISKEVLKALQQMGKSIVLAFAGYTITIHGDDVVNYENEFDPDIKMKKTKMGTEFVINNGKSLPGSVSIKIEDKVVLEGRYLYLFNHSKNKYELLKSTLVTGQMEVDTTGRYLIREKKLSKFNLNIIIVIIGAVCLLGCTGAYIFVKKKHWFW